MTEKEQLEALLTGYPELDRRIQEAFDAGRRLGMAEDRENVKQTARIDTTKKALLAIMRQQHLTLEQAMLLLQIPRKERKRYIGMLSHKRG